MRWVQKWMGRSSIPGFQYWDTTVQPWNSSPSTQASRGDKNSSQQVFHPAPVQLWHVCAHVHVHTHTHMHTWHHFSVIESLFPNQRSSQALGNQKQLNSWLTAICGYGTCLLGAELHPLNTTLTSSNGLHLLESSHCPLKAPWVSLCHLMWKAPSENCPF
jgi:hypothetical protein